MVAQFVARSAPSRLAGLILMDTAHGPLTFIDPELIKGAVSIVRSQGMDGFAAVLADGQGPLHTAAHQRLLDEKPGYAEFGDRKLRASSPAMYAAMAPAFITTPDRLESLRKLPESLAVLVIVGELDKGLVGSSRRMAESVSNGTLSIIPDAGHSPQFENPDAWWEALSGYLAAV
jgi:pimeloyl-ACP methyl ester carboxylesterase